MEDDIDELMELVGTKRIPIYHYYIAKGHVVKTIRYDDRNGGEWKPIWRSNGSGKWSWSTYEIQEQMRSRKAGFVNHIIGVVQIGGEWKGEIKFLSDYER